MSRAPRRAVVGAVALLMLLSGCTVGPSQRPPVAVRGGPAAPPAASPTGAATVPDPDGQNAALPFTDCTAQTFAALPPVPAGRPLRADCAELTVAADPAEPTLGHMVLDVVRVGLVDAPGRTDLATRPPLLVLGDTTRDPTARHAATFAEQVPATLLARYALIGMDRRGTGSDALSCSPTTERAALLDADPVSFDPSTLLDDARAVVQECDLAPDGELGGYSSDATATDVDTLRQSLGVRRLSAIGSGDAAASLLTWAGVEPGSVARLVLDGPPAPGIDEPDRSEGRARSAEAAFDAFALRCADLSSCPLGADPRAAVTALVARLRNSPLATADGRRLTAGATLTAVRVGLGEPNSWPELAAALAAASAGDAGPLLDVLVPLTGPRGTYDAVLATGCNDADRRLAPAEITSLATRWRTAYPLFGGSAAVGLAACAPWPTGGAVATTSAPTPPAGLPPVLVVGTAADPAAPEAGSRSAADALPSSVYLGWQGAGTGAYPRTACIDALVDGLLVDGTLPRPAITCPP